MEYYALGQTPQANPLLTNPLLTVRLGPLPGKTGTTGHSLLPGAGTFFPRPPTGASSVAPFALFPLSRPCRWSPLLLSFWIPHYLHALPRKVLVASRYSTYFPCSNQLTEKHDQNLPPNCYSLVLSLYSVVLRACFSATSVVGADYLIDIKSYLLVLFIISLLPDKSHSASSYSNDSKIVLKYVLADVVC